MEKMTKRIALTAIIAMMNGEETPVTAAQVVEFATHEIELLDKKSASKAEKKISDETASRMEQVFSILSTDVGMIPTDIIKAGDFPVGTSTQQITADLNRLAKLSRVHSEKQGRKTVWFAD